MHVVLVARDAQRLSDLAEIIARDSSAEVLQADLSTPEGMDTVCQRAMSDDVELLVNNAGFGLNTAFSESDVESEQQLLDVLVTAVMRVSHAALPGMLERKRGGVITVSSVAGWLASGTYSAAKAWATVFSESLYMQTRGSGVHVMALCPGFTRSEFQQRAGMSTDTIPNWMWLDSAALVRDALQDFEDLRPVSVPSLRYKLLALVAQYAPRPIVRKLGVISRRR
jgi:short-subunit dehydrogenase